MKPQPSAPGRIRRALRLAGWNALFLVAGLVLIGVVGEMYFRLRVPFVEGFHPCGRDHHAATAPSPFTGVPIGRPIPAPARHGPPD